MIYYLVIGIYLIGLLIIGLSKSDSIKNQEDFSVAGRSLSTWVLVGTMAATWMGTGSVLGNAGKTFEIGAAGFLLPIGGMLGVLVLTKIAGKARASGKLTVPEIIGSRFGDIAMILSVFALLAAYLVIVSYQFNAGGAVIYTIFHDNLGSGITLDQATIIAALFIVAYTVLAGLLSVAYTDVANGILMITCFIIALPILFFQAGGFDGMSTSFENKGMINNMSMFGVLSFREVINFTLPSFLLILGDANMYQRFFASESVQSVKKATYLLFFAIVILESLIVANAWISSSMITDIAKESHVLIYAAYNFLPPFIGALMLATIIGIIISTADSFLLVPTTILINDIYLKYSNRKYSDKTIVLLSRMLVLLLGFFSYWVSRMFAADTTIFEKALYAFTIYGTAITPSLLAAFFWEKATKYGAICSILSGTIATVYYGNKLGLDETVVPALIISSLALILISLI
ncbi:MAG: sodium:solute symporter family protein, partial [Candidatus Neomarinimicrobiota bacterium]|nr:sodium:solute symporter family protein [Candidatus Neomarinimicrobiota bacterium]